MRKTWSCGTFRAVTAAKGVDEEGLCLVCSADSLQEVLVTVPARQDKGLVSSSDVAGTEKWHGQICQVLSLVGRRRTNPQWAHKLLTELCGTDRRELSASPRLDVVGELPVLPAQAPCLTPGYSCPAQGKAAPPFTLGMCSVLGLRCYSGSCCCVICSVAHETAILHWFPTPLHEFIINSFIMLFSREIPDCCPWEVYPGLSLQLFGKRNLSMDLISLDVGI